MAGASLGYQLNAGHNRDLTSSCPVLVGSQDFLLTVIDDCLVDQIMLSKNLYQQ